MQLICIRLGKKIFSWHKIIFTYQGILISVRVRNDKEQKNSIKFIIQNSPKFLKIIL